MIHVLNLLPAGDFCVLMEQFNTWKTSAWKNILMSCIPGLFEISLQPIQTSVSLLVKCSSRIYKTRLSSVQK